MRLIFVLTALPPVFPPSARARAGSKRGNSARSSSANEGSKKSSMTTCLNGVALTKDSRYRPAFSTTAADTSVNGEIAGVDIDPLCCYPDATAGTDSERHGRRDERPRRGSAGRPAHDQGGAAKAADRLEEGAGRK